MKTISKEFAKKISGVDLGVYDTKNTGILKWAVAIVG